jgi:hypothetical protein
MSLPLTDFMRLGSQPPRLMGGGSEDAEGGSADEVGLQVEGLVDGGAGAREALGGSLTFEPPLLALPPPDRQVAVLGAIVRPHAARSVTALQVELAHRCPIRRS